MHFGFTIASALLRPNRVFITAAPVAFLQKFDECFGITVCRVSRPGQQLSKPRATPEVLYAEAREVACEHISPPKTARTCQLSLLTVMAVRFPSNLLSHVNLLIH